MAALTVTYEQAAVARDSEGCRRFPLGPFWGSDSRLPLPDLLVWESAELACLQFVCRRVESVYSGETGGSTEQLGGNCALSGCVASKGWCATDHGR
jgi:hypothetical protein